jgi:hypothetical protein
MGEMLEYWHLGFASVVRQGDAESTVIVKGAQGRTILRRGVAIFRDPVVVGSLGSAESYWVSSHIS